MSFKHVILGLLNREPLTGYDIKKIIEKTPFLYWSGNNNQIYKALAELSEEGLATSEVEYQEGAPSRKLYTITDAGRWELNNWLLSTTEGPVLRKQILVKLSLADHLDRRDVEEMLDAYARQVKMELALSERDLAQSRFTEQAEKAVFLKVIQDNIHSFYSNELAWIDKVREAASVLPDEVSQEDKHQNKTNEVENAVTYKPVEVNGKNYLHVTGSPLLSTEQEALDIIAQCAVHDTNSVLVDGELAPDFFNLKTRLAGAVLQKFGMYNIKVAVVLNQVENLPERFREMATEQNTGGSFRLFANVDAAVDWLLS